MKSIKLDLEPNDLQIIINCLVKEPYMNVAKTMDKIKDQITSQEQKNEDQ